MQAAALVCLAAASGAAAAHGVVRTTGEEESMGRRRDVTSFGTSRRGPLAGDRLPAPPLKTGNGGEWPTEHYDTFNSGSSTYIGPGDVQGFCRRFVMQSSLLSPNAERLAATGVTSLSDVDAWFGGGSTNMFHMVQLTSDTTWTRWDVNLTLLNPAFNTSGFVQASDYGVVSSPAAWSYDVGDVVSIPSGDGSVYTVWWLSCIALDAVSKDGRYTFAMDPLAAQVASMEIVLPTPARGSSFNPAHAATVYALDREKAEDLAGVRESGWGEKDFPACPMWVARFANGAKATFSPVRYTMGIPSEIVLASETEAQIDAGGILHAFNAYSGAELWNHAAVDETGVWWGLGGLVPVVDLTRNGLVYLAYGPRVVALDPSTGAVLASVNTSGMPTPTSSEYTYRPGYLDDGDQLIARNMTYTDAVALCDLTPRCRGFTHNAPDRYPTYITEFWLKSAFKLTPAVGWSSFQAPGWGIDPFVSSLMMDPDSDSLMVHSAAGTVWKVSIGGDATSLTLNVAWGCDYVINPPDGYIPCLTPPEVYKRTFPSPIYGSDGVVRPGDVSKGEFVHRGDYVNGGWLQPTTVTDRDELHGRVRDAYAASLGVGVGAPGSPVPARLPTVTEAADMLRHLERRGQLPGLHAARLRNGYTKLGSDGRAKYPLSPTPHDLALGASIFSTVYPYSTPAVGLNDIFFPSTTITVPQFLPYERGDEGVFTVLIEDGTIQWAFASWNTTEGVAVNFGRSRSSAAIDGDNIVYVGADIDDPHFSGGTSGITVPVLFALDFVDGSLEWASTMGFPSGTRVGHASPIVIDGWNEANSMYMSSDHGLVLVEEGTPCPTDDAIYDCSQHGSCDCKTGLCTCDPNNLCYQGAACGLVCVQGTCDDPSIGSCACNPCWSGLTCNVALTCGLNAQCGTSTGNCSCMPGYIPVHDSSGDCILPFNPTVGPSPSPAPGGFVPASGGSPSAGSVAAGILVGGPAIALAAFGAFIALFKYKNPAKPWFMALPQPVQKKLGLVGYSSMTAASVVGAGAGGKSPAVPKAMIKIPSIMRGNNEDSLARAKLLSAASAKGGSGGFAAAGKSSSGYGAV